MDTLFGDGRSGDQAAVVARVAAEACRSYGPEFDPVVIDVWAREAVAAVWGDGVRVSGFVPVLALRDVRERARVAAPATPLAAAAAALEERGGAVADRDDDVLVLDAHDVLTAD